MRLFFVKSVCRKCDHENLSWISESQRKAAFTHPPDELMGVQTCKQRGCGDDVPILARHLREATFDHHRTQEVARNPRLRNLRLSPNLAPPVPKLTERQAKICTLILKGMTDRAIARALKIERPTVRQHIQYAAQKLCADEPLACRVLPRQTIVAYYTAKAGGEQAESVFKIPA